MLITRDLNSEFNRGRRQEASVEMLRTAASSQGPYTYLAPGLVRDVREPTVVNYPMPVRVGNGIAKLGSNSLDSSTLTGVEKRALTRYASHMVYTEPEIKYCLL